jgi:tripartite-type tricarboxylate transporter receptor subunit TctC
MKKIVIASVFSLLALFAITAKAQGAYPNKSIRMVLGFPAGGTSDALARDVAEALTRVLGQPVVVDNRPGAGGNVGNEIVAKAVPDGYTILFASSSIAIAAAVYSKLGYDPLKDLAPIIRVASVPNLMAVPVNLPANNVKEFVDMARLKPGSMSYASAGNGSVAHLSGAMLASMAKVDLMHVPYKGNAPATTDLMSGLVQANFNQISFLLPLVNAGKLKALAVASRERSSLLPNVPTMAEQGFADYDLEPWFGMFAPAGTPLAIVERLSSEVDRIVNSPEMKKRWEQQGGRSVGGTSASFAKFFAEESARMGKLARDVGAKID